LLRSGREGSKILVDAAQGAVIVQSGVIKDLERRISAQEDEIAELRSHMAEINQMRSQIRELESDRETLRKENEQLRARVASLEMGT